jgi:Cu/Ag efflux pump CusA
MDRIDHPNAASTIRFLHRIEERSFDIRATNSQAAATWNPKPIAEVPEVVSVGRRIGRAELDEHAEGVHSSEIDVDLKVALQHATDPATGTIIAAQEKEIAERQAWLAQTRQKLRLPSQSIDRIDPGICDRE